VVSTAASKWKNICRVSGIRKATSRLSAFRGFDINAQNFALRRGAGNAEIIAPAQVRKPSERSFHWIFGGPRGSATEFFTNRVSTECRSGADRTDRAGCARRDPSHTGRDGCTSRVGCSACDARTDRVGCTACDGRAGRA